MGKSLGFAQFAFLAGGIGLGILAQGMRDDPAVYATGIGGGLCVVVAAVAGQVRRQFQDQDLRIRKLGRQVRDLTEPGTAATA